MGIELILRHESAEHLTHDFEANLRKGRAFVPGSSGLSQRELCGLRRHGEIIRELAIPDEVLARLGAS